MLRCSLHQYILYIGQPSTLQYPEINMHNCKIILYTLYIYRNRTVGFDIYLINIPIPLHITIWKKQVTILLPTPN